MKTSAFLRTSGTLFFLTLSFHFLSFTATVFAQAPAAIPYQAVARDGNGDLIQNQGISLRFSIHDGAPNGQVVYRESHHPNTNEFGLFTVNIGQGTPDIGNFFNIHWGNGGKFAQVELDAGGGNNYVNMGTQPMLSVPYAMHAATCDTALSITETDPKVAAANYGSVPRWSGTTLSDGSIYDDGNNVGIGTTSPDQTLDVIGTTKTTNLQMTSGAANGYVLQSDENGNGAWVNPASFIPVPALIQNEDASIQVKAGYDSEDVGLHFTNANKEYFSMYGPQLNVHYSGRSVFVGEFAGESDDLTNNENVFLGYAVGSANTTGEGNIGVGFSALLENTTGNGNTGLGHEALRNNLTGAYNTAVGNSAGLNCIGSGNVFIGNDAGADETGSNKLYIDNSDTGNPLIWGDFSDDFLNFNAKVGIGTTAPDQALDVIGTTKTTNFQMTSGAANGYVLQSDGSGNGSWVNPSSLTIAPAVIQDADASTQINVGSSETIRFKTGGTEYFTMEGPQLNVQNSGSSVFIGQFAGENDDLSDNENTFVGFTVGSANTTGQKNVAVGSQAMLQNTTGNNNVAIGFEALRNNLTGIQNTILGQQSGKNSTGNRNVFLGYNSGMNETGSDKLYIDNSNTSSPLIWGDFSNDYLNFNAKVGIGTTSPTQKLEVVGTTKTTNLQITNGATNGYVLKSDASGNASWVNPASINTTISDADGNTKIQAEQTTNDDKIHYTLGGTEYFTMKKATLEVNVGSPGTELEFAL